MRPTSGRSPVSCHADGHSSRLSSVESWVGLQELPQRLKTLNLHSTRDHAWSAPDPDATKAASLPLLQPPPSSDSAPSAMRMWLGNTLVETAPSMAYLNAWNTLANASWGFDFPLIQKLLREGPGLDEQWVNLYRPSMSLCVSFLCAYPADSCLQKPDRKSPRSPDGLSCIKPCTMAHLLRRSNGWFKQEPFVSLFRWNQFSPPGKTDHDSRHASHAACAQILQPRHHSPRVGD